MAKGYTTKSQIENYLLITIDDSFDLQITSWIESVEAYIDNFTGRNFVAGAEDEEKLYDGDNTSELLIDDLLEITSVKINDVAVNKNYAYAYPANKTPKNRLVLTNGLFTKGNQNIRVTGTFGYSTTVPSDIKHAATVLVAGIINAANKTTRSETIGNYSVTYDTDRGWNDFQETKKILAAYRKFTF